MLVLTHCGGISPAASGDTPDSGSITEGPRTAPRPSEKVQIITASLSADWPGVSLPQDYDMGIHADGSWVCALQYWRSIARSPNTKSWVTTGSNGDIIAHVRAGAIYPNQDQVIVEWQCTPASSFGSLWTAQILSPFTAAGTSTLLGGYRGIDNVHATMVGMGGGQVGYNSLYVDGSGYWEQSAGVSNYGPGHQDFTSTVQWQVLGTNGSWRFSSCEVDGAGGSCTLPDETLTPGNSFCSFDQQTEGNVVNSLAEIDGSSGQWVLTAQAPAAMLNGAALARMECLGFSP